MFLSSKLDRNQAPPHCLQQCHSCTQSIKISCIKNTICNKPDGSHHQSQSRKCCTSISPSIWFYQTVYWEWHTRMEQRNGNNHTTSVTIQVIYSWWTG